ncbi:MAG: TIGR02206 family membrane protein [Lachnospiraceae bacterium]|nr:TIGR02206 family membrane protein [Lachnospiraceae bacterium]
MYFFALRSEVLDGVGFQAFGPVHLTWLAVIALFVVLMLRFLRGRERAQRTAALLTAILAVSLVVGLEFYFYLRGELNLRTLPLQLCESAPFLLLLFYFTGWDWLGQTLYCLCLPGAAAALLFPAWTVFPQWNLINLQSFLLHALLILGPLLEVQRGALRPDIRHMWKTWVFLAAVVPCIYLIDRRFGANYFFLNAGSPGSPLEWLIRRVGNPGFLLGYAGIVLAVNVVMYGLYALCAHSLHLSRD